MSDQVVALLLDDAMPAERLGKLLRAARKRHGWSRERAAKQGGTTVKKLRAYEKGNKAVPGDVCARLAECYGADLTAHVPRRVPPHASAEWLAIGKYEQPIMDGGPDEIIAGYIGIVQRLRRAKAGDPLPLRATDMTVLAGALAADSDEIERRIAAALGCTRDEARVLHNELLRRRLIIPVASLALGVAAFAGVASASQSDGAPTPPAHHTVPAHVPARQVVHHLASVPTTTTSPTTVHHAPSTAPAPQHLTDATVPAPENAPDAPAPMAPPHIDPGSGTPVSILPGETPITVIGDATSVTETPRHP